LSGQSGRCTISGTRRVRTTPAARNPAVYVQARAGHAQASMTERYVHAAQVAFPGAADKAERRLFAAVGDRGLASGHPSRR
jgi:hypothetical protein